MPDLQFSDASLAALYDAGAPRSERHDFDFYLPLARAAEAVLDLGCGTGSFLAELRRSGHAGRLCGLDPAEGMIEQARRHAGVEWRLGDLPSSGFAADFDLIVMAGHAFQVFVTDAEIADTLTAAHAALRPGGRLAFERRNPAARGWEAWADIYSTSLTAEDGQPIAVVCRLEGPFDGRTVTFTQRYSGPAWSSPRVSWSTLRFLTQADLRARLAAAGFAIEAQYGDWDRSTVSERSPEIITIARR